jgi:hypothetical protein
MKLVGSIDGLTIVRSQTCSLVDAKHYRQYLFLRVIAGQQLLYHHMPSDNISK